MDLPKQGNGPIFVVGAPRSGTTLLQYMLRSHPRISLPTSESHFFIPLYRNQASFGDLEQVENVRRVLGEMHRISADFLETNLHGMHFDLESLAEELHAEGRHTVQGIIAGLFEKNARGESKARWGDKTPYYVLHMPKLLEWFPDAQIIHLIRDGRDCALSMFERKHDFKVYNTYFAAKYWQHYVDTGRELGSRLGANTYMEVRYEDMLADPVAATRRICEFLGEEYSDSLVNYNKSREVGKTPLLQKPIQKENAQKWRTKMSPWQVKVFESAAGDTLSRFNYDVNTSAETLPLPLRAMYRLDNNVMSWLYRNVRKLSRRCRRRI